MRFSHFFVDRPIFATVLSIVLLLVGGIAYTTLPVAQYPEIAPPTIVVRASYPGADSQTVAATVATPLEQQINGVEDMLYMSSYSTSDGSMSLTIAAISLCAIRRTPSSVISGFAEAGTTP